jgi:transposase-like protein
LDVKKRFSEEQIIGFLKEADRGVAVKELCRRHGFSEASYYLWRSKFGGMEVSDAKRLKALESENARLKKVLAESMLENEISREALRKNGDRTGATQPGAVDDQQGPDGTAQSASDRHERQRAAIPAV